MNKFAWFFATFGALALIAVAVMPSYMYISHLMAVNSKLIDRVIPPNAAIETSKNVEDPSEQKGVPTQTTQPLDSPSDRKVTETTTATTQEHTSEEPVIYNISFSPTFTFQGVKPPEKPSEEEKKDVIVDKPKDPVVTPTNPDKPHTPEPHKDPTPPTVEKNQPQKKEPPKVKSTASLLIFDHKTGKQHLIEDVSTDNFELNESTRRLKRLSKEVVSQLAIPDIERILRECDVYKSYFEFNSPSDLGEVVTLVPTEKSANARMTYPKEKRRIFRAATVKRDGVSLEFHPITDIEMVDASTATDVVVWRELPGYIARAK
jgi:hypothetical protein